MILVFVFCSSKKKTDWIKMYENMVVGANSPQNITVDDSIWTQIQNNNAALKQMLANWNRAMRNYNFRILKWPLGAVKKF